MLEVLIAVAIFIGGIFVGIVFNSIRSNKSETYTRDTEDETVSVTFTPFVPNVEKARSYRREKN